MLHVQSKRAELITRALPTTQHKQPNCPQNEFSKTNDRSTIPGRSTKHGEYEVFQASNEPVLLENINEMK